MTGRIRNFYMALLFVFPISVSTWCVSHGNFVGVFLSGFVISYIWTCNVKRIGMADRLDQVIYALGGATGAAAGLAFSMTFLRGG
jgi:hypothetical protein